MYAEAFLLGLSTGTYCAMFCAPVIIPVVFSTERGLASNAATLGLFTLGRLAGYLAVGAVLGALGSLGSRYIKPELEHDIRSVSWTLIGALMLLQALPLSLPRAHLCARIPSHRFSGLSAWLLGLLTGLNPCPPFLAAATRVVNLRSPLSGSLYFSLFFLGTSLYLAPLLGVPLLGKRLQFPRIVSRGALLLLGVYFLVFQGILSFI